jgi:asparagine synthase (glutamine-hydrolysing)
MCGIVVIGSSSRPVCAELVTRMRDTMRHRGPDDEGLWRADDGSVVLGHRRLSIIDLSAGGHQPMADAAGECRIVFNGEIYNYQELREDLRQAGHRFRSASDTEVLLAAYRAWGPECVHRLNGMFAFAIYDEPRRQLFVARDRAGEKPLFYRHADGQFALASELKALFADPACPRVLDPAALDLFLAFGYVPHDRCIVGGVRKLPPAHALLYDLRTDDVRTWQYWSLPLESGFAQTADGEELLSRLEELLFDSVRLRLIADVPVGVMLSGGIDSSLVTAMAARATPKIKTFTIAFPGHGNYDEAPHARIVAEHFGTDHVVLEAEQANVDLLPELARQYDEPLGDSSMVPTYLVSRLIRSEARVALGGDGGDELFGGYPHHSWVLSLARLRSLIPGGIGAALRPLATAALPVGVRGRNYVLGLTGDQTFAIGQFNQYFDVATRRRLLAPLNLQPGGDLAEEFKASLWRHGSTALQQATAVDFRSYMPDDILVKIDRASMLASLEVRAPWLDPRLVEFAFSKVPDRLRATASERKVLPKRLAARLLPPAMDLQRKQGFSLPLGAWFKGQWGSFVGEVLTAAPPAVFEAGVVRELLADQRRGYSNTQRLFALTMFELWRQEYRITLP